MDKNKYLSNASQLDRLYANTPEKAIAFIDETYRLQEGYSEPPYYVMSAVVVQVGSLVDLREYLIDTAKAVWPDDTYWHTTEALKRGQPNGHETTLEILRDLGAHNSEERAIICVQSQIGKGETDTEVRARVFTTLMRAVSSGKAGTPTRTFILEARNLDYHRAEDLKLFDRYYTRCGKLEKPVFRQTTPTTEPLLWLPDLVCGAYRRAFIGQTNKYFLPIRDVSAVIKVVPETRAEVRSRPQETHVTNSLKPLPVTPSPPPLIPNNNFGMDMGF